MTSLLIAARAFCYVMLFLFTLLPAHASPLTIATLATVNRLSNAQSDWHSEEVLLSYQIAQGHHIEGLARHARRFDLSDIYTEINYTRPLANALIATFSAGASPSHRVLPKQFLGTAFQYQFRQASLLHISLRGTQYTNANVIQSGFGVEHYFSKFSTLVEAKLSRLSDVIAGVASLRFNYYYTDHAWIGVQYTMGREAENIDGKGISVSNVQALAFDGRHTVSKHWALRYGLERVQQGNLYYRTEVRLGGQYRF